MRRWSIIHICPKWPRANFAVLATALLTAACGASPTGPSDAGARASLTRPSDSCTGGRTFFASRSGSDLNPGTRTEPWYTIMHGATQLCPGDTLYVRGGTYLREQIRITSGGTSSNPITIAGFEEEEVIISGGPGADHMLSFGDSTGYFVMERLIIDGRGESGVTGMIILADSSHHVRLTQVEVRNALNHGIFGGGTDHQFIDLKVHGNGVSDYQNSNGVYLTTDNSTIVGGEFYDNACYGVRIFDSTSTETAINNEVTGAKIYGNGYSVGLGGRSRCVSSGGGLVLGDVNNRANDNLVYQNLQGIAALGSKVSNGIQIVGNTVRDNIGIGIDIQLGAVNAVVRNNHLSGNGKGIVNFGTATILSNNGPQ